MLGTQAWARLMGADLEPSRDQPLEPVTLADGRMGVSADARKALGFGEDDPLRVRV